MSDQPSSTFKPIKYNEPLILRNSKVTNWPCYQWKTKDWLRNCADLQLNFRIHDKDSQQIPWENEAITRIDATLDQFLDWRNNKITQPNNSFADFDPANFWAYSSYNHLAKLPYESSKALIESISWSSIDFGSHLGKDGSSSTLWIGSTGAATPCHYDTYGYNIVTQIVGKKLWILFPPSDAVNLYPTRIPFEESSVFSEVNLCRPDFNLFPKFREAHPYSVILEPGDVLYVPHHWWHYVKCYDDQPDGLCISINQWLPTDNTFDSLCEGVTSLLINTLFPFYQPDDENWLNDSTDDSLLNDPSMIISLIGKLSSNQSNLCSKIDRWIDYIPENCEPVQEIDYNQLMAKYFPDVDVKSIHNKQDCENKIGQQTIEHPAKSIIKCFLKPNVIELISKNILDEIRRD
ncbi:HSPB1-associated protein 1 [Tetranychus urticae]|uniref:JmjC domain-containing protein n=1 Tax=Tetranychus urticae TaxID=32264 RepID=T1JVY3_TETUR|nr:HSPB1-associated protein 1 [Tetranychus urticae]XP_025018569.1 HSPB1-associated protein 1 [Tetranychus urticae]